MTKHCEPKKTSKTKSCRSFVARVKLPCSDCSWARWTRRKRCGSQQCMNWGYRFFCPLQPRLQQIVSLATFSNEDSHLFSTPPSPGPSWFLLAYTSQRLSSEKHLWWFWIRICASSLMCVVHWKIQDYESTHRFLLGWLSHWPHNNQGWPCLGSACHPTVTWDVLMRGLLGGRRRSWSKCCTQTYWHHPRASGSAPRSPFHHVTESDVCHVIHQSHEMWWWSVWNLKL